jgi:hypothetical protein
MGFCNEYHFKRGLEDETLFKILKENPQLSTIRDARLYLAQSEVAKQDKTLAKRSAE